MAQARNFTDREMLRCVWDREKIQDVMARRAYYAANNQRGRELEELWVSGEAGKSAAYGKTWGYYIGLEAIRDYYVTRYDAALEAQLAAFRRANPGAAAEKGVGSVHFHPLSTPLIEIAGDGETAKGLWYSIGQRTELDEGGAPRAWWVAMKVGADFRREVDGWKIWHLVEIYDVVNEDGTDYKEVPYCYPEGGHPMRAEFGTPTLAMLTHDERFNWWDNYPPEPAPYETFSDAISYGPEGHPDYPGKEAKA